MDLIAIREDRKLQESFHLAEQYLERAYLHNLSNYEVLAIPKHIAEISVQKNIRLFQITKIVYDKKEDVTEKLVNIYNTVGSLGSSLALIIDSDGQEVKLYIGVRSTNALSAQDGLEKSFKGNFPGTELKNMRNAQIETIVQDIFTGRNLKHRRSICSVTGIPALKDIENKEYIQGLEKLIDAMRGEKFSALFLANPIPKNEALTIRHGYEDLYSSLIPFQNTQLTAGKNESSALTKGISEGITNTVNDSITKTQSYTEGSSSGSSESETTNDGVNVIRATISEIFGGKTGSSRGVTTNYNSNESNTMGTSFTECTARSTATTTNKNDTKTEGTSSTMQVNLENKKITNLLEKIDLQLERLQSADDLGLWHYACYFIADDEQTARVAATNYQSIIRGDNSAIEGASINIWNERHVNNAVVSEYLMKLNHPLLNMEVVSSSKMPHVTTGTLINGRELAIAYSLPRKSVSGLPVIETAEFGRNVYYLSQPDESNNTIDLGEIYYMGQVESTKIKLDIQSLSMHTFITGSTGSGKSNTIYHILDGLTAKGINYLVVEPAKGEYKNVFGGHKNVSVFGTNPQYTPLLKLNPFRFPREVHVLEHIDRLIEIFNACWPMYAAMPAVLKEAVELLYEQDGWDLESSTHFEARLTYPTLSQLVDILPHVIESSGYSEEVKSNYVGALVTRVKSLTNGLIGKVLVDQEIENELIFDRNCIVDLSRIGSSETKSLLMGILFMRLQEHRISKSAGMNEPLKHVTVLEEAHHLLRKTSSAQSDEGANLQGKSVEMITNAIAEMRTYGEGFIIADQSPNLLDTSVIRNTNTKIIMRLPEGQDRREVGEAASLTEEQINEIPKLETGVAIVYQNNWLQPVLGKINYFSNDKPFQYQPKLNEELKEQRHSLTTLLSIIFHDVYRNEISIEKNNVEVAFNYIKNATLPEHTKQELEMYVDGVIEKGALHCYDGKVSTERARIINILLDGRKLLIYAKASNNLEQLHTKLERALARYINCKDKQLVTLVIQNILYYESLSNEKAQQLYKDWFEYRNGEVATV